MVAVRDNHPPTREAVHRHRAPTVNARTRTGDTPQWVLPNSVPGFGHGIGIVRGGLPARGSRAPIPGRDVAAAVRRARRPARVGAAAARRAAPTSSRPTPTASRRSSWPSPTTIRTWRGSSSSAAPNIKAVDWYGRTPLWAAVETRNMDVDNAHVRQQHRPRAAARADRGAARARAPTSNVRMKEVPPIRRHMPAHHRLARVGGLHRPDAVPDRGRSPATSTVMRLLLKHGADPHIPTFGGTTRADGGGRRQLGVRSDRSTRARRRCSRRCKLCVELGMDVNAVNSMGLTALHGAANRGSDDIIRFLVEKGARLDVEGQGRPHAADVGRRRLPGHASGAAEAELDRAASSS